jgi:hypothetical protein
MNLIIMEFSPPVSFSLYTKMSLSTLPAKTLSLLSSHNVKDEISQSCATGKVLCFFAAKWRAKLLNRMVRSIHRK